MNPQVLQLIVVLAPILGSVILTPVLVALINRAKQKAEAENIEVSSDKLRFDSMDMLVNHMREEVKTLKVDVAGERAVANECRAQARQCEQEKEASDRAGADAIRWGISMYEQLTHMGASPARPPLRVLGLVDSLDTESTRTFRTDPPRKQLPG